MTALLAVIWIPRHTKAWKFKRTLSQNLEPFWNENLYENQFSAALMHCESKISVRSIVFLVWILVTSCENQPCEMCHVNVSCEKCVMCHVKNNRAGAAVVSAITSRKYSTRNVFSHLLRVNNYFWKSWCMADSECPPSHQPPGNQSIFTPCFFLYQNRW